MYRVTGYRGENQGPGSQQVSRLSPLCARYRQSCVCVTHPAWSRSQSTQTKWSANHSAPLVHHGILGFKVWDGCSGSLNTSTNSLRILPWKGEPDSPPLDKSWLTNSFYKDKEVDMMVYDFRDQIINCCLLPTWSLSDHSLGNGSCHPMKPSDSPWKRPTRWGSGASSSHPSVGSILEVDFPARVKSSDYAPHPGSWNAAFWGSP